MSEAALLGREIANSQASLPSGWRWATLGEVATYYNGRAFKPEEWRQSGLPIIRIQNLTSREATFNYYDGPVEATNKVASDDLLVSWSASLDAYIWDSGPAVLNQHIFKVAEKEGITRRYLYHVVRYVMADIRARVHGATMRHITKPEFERIRIPLAPLPQQESLAAALDGQISIVARARAAAEAQLAAANVLLRSELQHVFDSSNAKCGPIVCLGDVLNEIQHIIHPSDNPCGPAVFVGLEHIESHTGIRTGSLPVEMSQLTGRKPRFRKGQIVYGYLRPYLNKVWIAEFDGLCSVDQYVYTVNPDTADTDFIAWFMRSPLYLNSARVDGGPGQLPRIRKEEVGAVQLKLPPVEKQRSIAARISSFAMRTQKLCHSLADQLHAIDLCTPALLRRAFNGELY